jgi:hypothetical protein
MLLSFERSGAGSISTGDCGHHGNFPDMNASTSVELLCQHGIGIRPMVSRRDEVDRQRAGIDGSAARR